MISLEDLGFEVAGEPIAIRLPTHIQVSGKKTAPCNINSYRNLHYHQLNTQKINFKDLIKSALRTIPRMGQIAIHYEIFAQSKGRIDTMNIGSIVDKYFSDAMVELGKLEDDNSSFMVFHSFSFGGVAKNDPHAIATITPVRKKADMRIFLDQDEIVQALLMELSEEQMEKALGEYIRNSLGFEPTEITINSDDGNLSVEISAGPGKPAEEKPKPKGRGGRPRGSKNKPKPAPEEVKPDVDGSAETGGDGSGKGDGGGADNDAPEISNNPENRTEPEAETPKSEGKQRKNLFSDEEESGSSSQPETKSDESVPSEKESSDTTQPVKPKKPSIFDVGTSDG